MSNIDGTSSATFDGTASNIIALNSIELKDKYILPIVAPVAGKYMISDGTNQLIFSDVPAGGDVIGAASSMDNHVVAFNGTSGKIIKDGGYLTSEIYTKLNDVDVNGNNVLGVVNVEAQTLSIKNSGGTDQWLIKSDAANGENFVLENLAGDDLIKINQDGARIAIGLDAGVSQGTSSIAIGEYAGSITQGVNSVAIGHDAGKTNQLGGSTAVGNIAGEINQGINAVAVGSSAGKTDQMTDAVAVGRECGETSQGIRAVAIGTASGFTGQGNYSVAVGFEAGKYNLGTRNIAIGQYASQGVDGVPGFSNCIVLNATGIALNPAQANSFYVNPIRANTADEILHYNTTTKEITYAPSTTLIETLQEAFDASGGSPQITTNVDSPIMNITQGAAGGFTIFEVKDAGGDVRFEVTEAGTYIGSSATIGSLVPATSWILVSTRGTAGQILIEDGTGTPAWGDTVSKVDGVSVNNFIPRFDGTTGNLLQNSLCSIDDTGILTTNSSILLGNGTPSLSWIIPGIRAGSSRMSLQSNGAGNTTWFEVLQPPASSTDNALVRFDGATGKITQNSGATIDDNGSMLINGDLHFSKTLFTSGGVPALAGIFSSTVDFTNGNTTTELPMYGAGIGYLTLPANAAQIGSCLNWRLGGYIDTATSTTLTVRYKIAATTIHTQVLSIASIPPNGYWGMDISFSIRTIGATATGVLSGKFDYDDSGTMKSQGIVKTGEFTFDSTQANLMTVTAQWTTANVNNTITTQHATLSTRF